MLNLWNVLINKHLQVINKKHNKDIIKKIKKKKYNIKKNIILIIEKKYNNKINNIELIIKKK